MAFGCGVRGSSCFSATDLDTLDAVIDLSLFPKGILFVSMFVFLIVERKGGIGFARGGGDIILFFSFYYLSLMVFVFICCNSMFTFYLFMEV